MLFVVAGNAHTMHYVLTVCEGDPFLLACPTGYEIMVEDAIFGRNDSYTCVHSYDVRLILKFI